MSILTNALASLSTPEIQNLLFRRSLSVEANIQTLRAFYSTRSA